MPEAQLGLDGVIAATAQWVLRSYPAHGGRFVATLAQAQVRQAVQVAAWLRYPTRVDVELLHLTGPGGSAALDAAGPQVTAGEPWRSWVDEVLASWALCLLADTALAARAAAAVAAGEHAGPLEWDFRLLVAPSPLEAAAAALPRHPDLTAAVADRHRAALLRALPRPRPPSP